MLNSVAPFFIVDDLGATLAFYQSKLGFDVFYKYGGDGNGDDYFAIMGRDRVMLMFKAITREVHPQPNRSRHEWARWDAYIGTDDPDSLYTEFVGRIPCIGSLANTSDGLRAFEITDNSGYVVCFGRPVDKWLQRRKIINPVTCDRARVRAPRLLCPEGATRAAAPFPAPLSPLAASFQRASMWRQPAGRTRA
jgi:hypothetical protein